MRSIKIKNIEEPIAELILGTDYFNLDNMEKIHEVMEAFIKIGGNTIDTAFVYGRGKSEQAIGKWLEENKRRDDIVILTKGGHPDPEGNLRVNKQAINEEINISLDRLRTDHVELYALHRDDPNVHVGEILEILNEHVEAGKIGAFGGSNWTFERLQEANKYAEENGLIGFSFSSPNFSLAKAQEPYWKNCISVDEQTLTWHEKSKLPIFSWSSQARGFFTGHFTPEDRSNHDLVRVFYNKDNWERYRRAEELAQAKGVKTIEISLAYVLNQSFPTVAIIGPQNEQEMISCKKATKITLSQEEIKWLDLRANERYPLA